jgi:hypothetical protein
MSKHKVVAVTTVLHTVNVKMQAEAPAAWCWLECYPTTVVSSSVVSPKGAPAVLFCEPLVIFLTDLLYQAASPIRHTTRRISLGGGGGGGDKKKKKENGNVFCFFYIVYFFYTNYTL